MTDARNAAHVLQTTAGCPSDDSDRRQFRTTTVFREAALTVGGRSGLCVVKNLSAGGAMIHTRMELHIDSPVTLTMSSSRAVAGHIRWVQDGFGGITFDTETSVSWLLDRVVAPEGIANRRLPRVIVTAPATITDEQGMIDGFTADISTHGVRLIVGRDLVLGPASVDLSGLGPVAGKILWSTSGQSGCVFARPFSVEDITIWLRTLE
ncbi:PilZ domain-containing protein [Sphingomonas sp. RS2018]